MAQVNHNFCTQLVQDSQENTSIVSSRTNLATLWEWEVKVLLPPLKKINNNTVHNSFQFLVHEWSNLSIVKRCGPDTDACEPVVVCFNSAFTLQSNKFTIKKNTIR